MEDYDLNLPADVVVNWLIQSAGDGDVRLSINAWREYVVDEDFAPEKSGYEGIGVQEVTAVGSLEVAPADHRESWILRVRVEDELGDRLPIDESAPEAPEEITLDAFWDEFMAPRRGMASIKVSATGQTEKKAFDRFIAKLEKAAAARRGAQGSG